jgi:hypothetical protein
MSVQDFGDDIWKKVFQQNDKIVSREIAGELFLVPVSGNLANMQRMFSLTSVAAYIWQQMDGQLSLGEIRDALIEQYDIDKNRADEDILEFTAGLLDAGLIA